MVFDPRTRRITITQMAGQVDKHATWKRVAFGAGTFVVAGQSGLLGTSTHGVVWEHNEPHPERGDITSVAWVGDRFLAVSSAKKQFESQDGRSWTETTPAAPKILVRAGEFMYGWAWPPHRVQRSRDGGTWEAVPNERQFYFKHVVRGELAGAGAPPAMPAQR
jgi:hypothetical protein